MKKSLILLVIVCLTGGLFGPSLAKEQTAKPLVPETPRLDDGKHPQPAVSAPGGQLQTGASSTELQTGASSTELQTGAASTQLQTGTTNTQLQGGTTSLQLQGKTDSNLLQGNAKINTLTIQDWQKMDLKGFTNQARLMPAIPATVRFVAINAKLDDKILKAQTIRLDSQLSDEGPVRAMIHLVRCPPADPGMRNMWRQFENEMNNEVRAELWRDWEESVQELAMQTWKKNAAGQGAVSYHVVIDHNFTILEVGDHFGGKAAVASNDLEIAARRTLNLIAKAAPHFPGGSGVEKVHLRVTFTNTP